MLVGPAAAVTRLLPARVSRGGEREEAPLQHEEPAAQKRPERPQPGEYTSPGGDITRALQCLCPTGDSAVSSVALPTPRPHPPSSRVNRPPINHEVELQASRSMRELTFDHFFFFPLDAFAAARALAAFEA